MSLHQLCPTRGQVEGFVRKLLIIVYVQYSDSLTLFL